MNQLLKYIEDKELAKAIKTMKENEAKKKEKEELVNNALPGFLNKFIKELVIIKSGGVSYWLEAMDGLDRGCLKIVFKYKSKSIYCEYMSPGMWMPFTNGQGTFGDWPSEKLLDFVSEWYQNLQPETPTPAETVKLIVNDPGDPSVGIFGGYFYIDCPFMADIDPAEKEFFRNQVLALFSGFTDGKLTAVYDFEIDFMA